MSHRLTNLRYLMRPRWIVATITVGILLFLVSTIVACRLNPVQFSFSTSVLGGTWIINGVTQPQPPRRMPRGWHGWKHRRLGAEDLVLACGDGMNNSDVLLPNGNLLGWKIPNSPIDPNIVQNADELAPAGTNHCASPIVRIQGARGWPSLAFRYQYDFDLSGQTSQPLKLLNGFWKTIPGAIYPVVPIWPGFALDLIFYIILAFGLLRGYPLIRGVARLANKRCIFCGYQLHDSFDAGCPECGWRRRESAPPTAPQP